MAGMDFSESAQISWSRLSSGRYAGTITARRTVSACMGDSVLAMSSACASSVLFTYSTGYRVLPRLWALERTGMRIGLILLACGLVWGQVDTGELRLSVSDSTGLALPSSGTLVSAASQTRREFKTDDAGRFTFQHLPFGMYRLTVEHASFTRSSSLIEIRSAVPREIRLELKVEAAATEVLVTDAATL